jgi:hypothetical protein
MEDFFYFMGNAATCGCAARNRKIIKERKNS